MLSRAQLGELGATLLIRVVLFALSILLEIILEMVEWSLIVASGLAAYFLLLVISYLLLSYPDVLPSRGVILLALSLVVLIPPGYVVIKAMWRVLGSMPVVLFLLILLLWPIFYLLIKDFVKDDSLALLFSFGTVLFFTLVTEAGAAFAALVIHLSISKRVWSLASRAREKASGKPLPKLFK
uniref:Uncharacterized protein n=1 Tax=Thermofilum adornatum TaxID=1365176 RepID=A0A7C1GJ56_9CREN